MPAIYFSKDYFCPKTEDGNLSLATKDSRIREALKSLNPDDWIELEDGTRCTNEKELRDALSSENLPRK